MTSSPTQTQAMEANKVKELVVRTMINEGFISREKGEDFLLKYAIVEHRRGWLGVTIDKLLPKNAADCFYRIVKLIQ
jgi:hypothetical protein